MAKRLVAATELRKAAEQLGLAYGPRGHLSGQRLSGQRGGIEVRVEAFFRPGPEDAPPVQLLRFRVRFPEALGLGLRLTRENFLTAIRKLFGAQDIKVGDRAFDHAVLVQGRSRAKVVDFLSRPRRVRIGRFLAGHHNAVIDDRGITWELAGQLHPAERIALTTVKMIDLAQHLARPLADDDAIQRALDARSQGRLEESLAALGDAQQATSEEHAPPRVDERVLEGEVLALADRHDDAKCMFEEALEHAPEDDELRVLAAEAGSSAAPDGESAAAGTDAHADARPSRALDEVCQTLFADSSSSIETNRAFESAFRDAIVHGRGQLLNAEAYSFDLAFGHEPGTRAIVEIGEFETNLLGERQVKAIVQLPADTTDVLRARKGETVCFAGTLVKVDGFMRNVYVAHARVLKS